MIPVKSYKISAFKLEMCEIFQGRGKKQTKIFAQKGEKIKFTIFHFSFSSISLILPRFSPSEDTKKSIKLIEFVNRTDCR